MVMGIHVKMIQELLGHSNIALTLNIYGHALPSMQAEASEKWDDLFGGQDEQEGDGETESEQRGEGFSGRTRGTTRRRSTASLCLSAWLSCDHNLSLL